MVSARRILLIEDEDPIRDLVATVLEREGHEVVAVSDGVSGLEALAGFRADLVILDLLTPRMHGYEVIRRLRASHASRRLPIIVLSAKAYLPDRRKALEMGANAFLPKPFKAQELNALVTSVLDAIRVRFWGVRGSIATPGPETVRYGGNTPCVTVEHGRDSLILDAGTGLRKLGLTLHAEAAGSPLDLQMLITHTHWDHIQGFPFFVPAFVPGNRVHVYGPPSIEKPLEKVLRGQMDPEYFPVALGEMAADVVVDEIREHDIQVGPFKVHTKYVNHPGVTMAYRIEVGSKVITYATDTEPYRTLLDDSIPTGGEKSDYGMQRDQKLVEFVADSDLYIADSQYTPEDYKTKRGWGHTCYVDAVAVALEGNVKRVALFSHDPMHDDDMIDEKLARSKAIAEEAGTGLEVIAAVEGSFVELPGPSPSED